MKHGAHSVSRCLHVYVSFVIQDYLLRLMFGLSHFLLNKNRSSCLCRVCRTESSKHNVHSLLWFGCEVPTTSMLRVDSPIIC